MAASNINNFKSSFKTDVARPSRFDISLPIPLTLIPYLSIARNLKFRCESTEFPSRTFATADQKFGATPIEKTPYHSQYNDITMTFVVSDNMDEKIFFEYWMEYINPTYLFDFRYKSDYITTMQVNQYNIRGDLIYSINLIEAYPVSINQLDLDWSTDGYHKLSVTFAYTYWVNNSIEQVGSSLIQSGISYLTDILGGLGPDYASVFNEGLPGNTLTTAMPTAPMSYSSLPTATNNFNSLISGNKITNLPNSPL